MMGGCLSAPSPGDGLCSVELPFAIDEAAYAVSLDLVQHPVLIVTKDADFAGGLIEALDVWHADARWIGNAETAFGAADGAVSDSRRPVLIVDGRRELLSALSWSHRAATMRPDRAPYILLATGEVRPNTVAALAEDGLTAILPAPLTIDMLRNALHSLRLDASSGSTALPAPIESFLPAPEEARSDASLSTDTLPPRRPVTEAADAPRQPRAEPPPPPLHVLVVAGNAANRRIIEHILRRGRCVVRLLDAVELISDALAENPIDLVLLDVAAPDVGRFQTVAGWRRARPDLSVIALLGSVSPEAERRCREAGIDTVLGKPVEPSQLLAAIEASRHSRKTATAPDRTRNSGPLSRRWARRAAAW
jgi:CheY-like chemotaxis protein